MFASCLHTLSRFVDLRLFGRAVGCAVDVFKRVGTCVCFHVEFYVVHPAMEFLTYCDWPNGVSKSEPKPSG